MNVERIRDEGQQLRSPTGKVLGIVETRADYEKLVPALKAAGFDRIESLFGDDGVQLLERVGGFFFSDMEERVLARHIDELKAGHMVVLISTPSDRVDELTEIAARNGARRLVHFGLMAVTWLTK